MIGGLIFPFKKYKTLTEFTNYDFKADKSRQYEEVQRIISKKCLVLFEGKLRCKRVLEKVKNSDRNFPKQ